MSTLSLALRNLMRNRRRSVTTLLAMVIGLSATLLFGGYASNSILAMQTGYVQKLGHLQIQRKDYFLYGSGNPAAFGIPDYQAIIDLVKADPLLRPLLTVVTPKLNLGGIAGNFSAGVSKTVLVAGVLVDEQNQMRLWNDYGSLSYARPLALTGSPPDAAVIGTGVARLLQLCGPLQVPNCHALPSKPAAAGTGQALPADIGALSALEQAQAGAAPDGGAETRIELLAANDHGVPNVASLKVVKAENYGLKELDDISVEMHLGHAQRLIFGADKPQVTAIQLQLQHSDQIAQARARLTELLAGALQGADLELQDFQTLAPIYGQTISFFDSMFGFIATLIGVIVLFTVGNTMSMAVVERTVEIGTLRAIGLRRSGIRRLFMVEGLLLGGIGVLLGLLMALLLAFFINHSGLTWTPPGYVYAYPLKSRVWGNAPLILGSSLGLILVATLSAWWPAKRAANLAVVDALRHV
ncbi:ABC transporter permease [Roseateles oligotrophus]|uniref:FtsX-like permease family protein n=1 Tax=Roseateles oligotrophus TaxID=1769250 RepID=A0ABT2YCI4_9BURK|nr:FtsX-like permease family protein [Roseateles oligotrophus]MCV2367758.1 FtsX-like permease family protein [Roseateles oligotrophus]